MDLGDDAPRPEQVNAAAPGEAGGDTACIVTDPEAELHFSEAKLHLTSRAVCDDPTCLSGRGIAREGVTSVAMESELEQDQADPLSALGLTLSQTPLRAAPTFGARDFF